MHDACSYQQRGRQGDKATNKKGAFRKLKQIIIINALMRKNVDGIIITPKVGKNVY